MARGLFKAYSPPAPIVQPSFIFDVVPDPYAPGNPNPGCELSSVYDEVYLICATAAPPVK